MTLLLLLSVATGAFADRTLIIPDLPKQSYRYGVGAYEGVVAHSTATPEAPAINIQKYETRTWRSAFVHYAVDWNETIQIADTKYIAYGAGPGANKRFVHVELCETKDYEKFKRSYDKYVKLLAKILRDRGLSVEKDYGLTTMLQNILVELIMKIHLIIYVVMEFQKRNLEQMYNVYTVILMLMFLFLRNHLNQQKFQQLWQMALLILKAITLIYVKDQVQAILRFVS